SGDGGLATQAQLFFPWGAAISTTLDNSGNLYIADTGNNRIRKVDGITGVITTVAGVANNGFYGDGGPAISATLNGPIGVAVDSSGNIYIADYYNHRIRKVTASTGIISTIAGSFHSGFSGDGGLATSARLYFPRSVAVDASGNVYIADS